ncbi:MAG: pyridoxal phosphate-dependent aminotransferase [Candidatus Binataceae bacterium]
MSTKPVPIDRVHGGDAPAGVIDFSVSINPLGPPPGAIAAYQSAIARVTSYPPAKSSVLEAGLARWMGVAPENVIAGNGTTQLIYLLARVLEPARPFVVIPTFSEIANALAGVGMPPEPIQLEPDRDYRFDIQQIERALADHAGAIFIGQPNSPTGTMLSADEVRNVAAQCADRGCWCVLDEAFIDFVLDAESAATLVSHNPRMIVLRSLTKSFAIPGLRLGCAVADREVAVALRDAIEPWSINVVAESVGLACIEDAADYLQRSREVVAAERAYLSGALAAIKRLRVFPSVANFLMVAVVDEATPGDFAAHTLRWGVAVRDLRAMPGCSAGLYRIGIRNHADNERLVSAASQWRT